MNRITEAHSSTSPKDGSDTQGVAIAILQILRRQLPSRWALAIWNRVIWSLLLLFHSLCRMCQWFPPTSGKSHKMIWVVSLIIFLTIIPFASLNGLVKNSLLEHWQSQPPPVTSITARNIDFSGGLRSLGHLNNLVPSRGGLGGTKPQIWTQNPREKTE